MQIAHCPECGHLLTEGRVSTEVARTTTRAELQPVADNPATRFRGRFLFGSHELGNFSHRIEPYSVRD